MFDLFSLVREKKKKATNDVKPLLLSHTIANINKHQNKHQAYPTCTAS